MVAAHVRILVVDDEPSITHCVCQGLEMLGYRPRAAYNGQQALDEVTRERPDLVILDLAMPILDGYAVLDALRADPETRGIPVIVLSALNAEPEVVRGLRAGATVYLSKPFDVEKLKALVTAVLGSRKGPP